MLHGPHPFISPLKAFASQINQTTYCEDVKLLKEISVDTRQPGNPE